MKNFNKQNSKIKVLIGCEYSGRVREAFKKLGFNAWSCDILPTEIPGNHFQCDIFEVVHKKWDLFIGFPPCTYLCSAGLHYCNIERHGQKAIDRIKKRNQAIEFFLDLYSLPIEHLCLENPVGHISSCVLKPTQIIHPYYFGEQELKRTALWLKNLPPLEYHLQDNLFSQKTASDYPQPYQKQLCKKTGKFKNRYFTDSILNNNFKDGKSRSMLFQCFADQMALQWSNVIND
jgi:hypothetical protein